MSLYSNAFQLLPRPSRNFFSSGSELTRAILPDFSDVAQLSQFTHRLLYWKVVFPSFFIQLKVGASFVCLLIVTVGLILAKRTYDRSLWFLRIMKRPAGSILVPNSTLMFAVMEGIFGIIFVAFLWKTCYYFDTPGHTPHNYMYWLVLPWCSLVFAAFWAAWGTYFATPNALQSPIDGNASGFFKRILLRPSVVNVTGLMIPGIMSLSVLIPVILSDRHWRRALQLEQEWQTAYSTQLEFSQDMVQASQAVWYETLQAMEKACVAYVMWTVFAIVVFLAFMSASWGLISAIRHELNKSSTLSSQDDLESSLRKKAANNESVKVRGDLASPLAPQKVRTRESHHLFAQAEKEGDTHVDSFFPSVRSHHAAEGQQRRSQVQESNQADRADDPQMITESTATETKSQQGYLQSALYHVCIQSCAISPACLSFGAIALLLSLTMYGRMEHASNSGGNEFEYFFSVAAIIVNYIACFFGAITLFAIAHRTYEPILSSSAILNKPRLAFQHHGNNKSAQAPKADQQKHTNTSFFETQSIHLANRHESSNYNSQRKKDFDLGQVQEQDEVDEVSDRNGHGHLLIERTVTIQEEERRHNDKEDDRSSINSDLDDNDYYFKGGAGRRTRTYSH
ncbi:hypothetical protein CBS101457_002389 [Exobasidium rhododendri]|nr:hypothetical protein CBS101457_002389 [Exobasidium rhododendri]